MGRRVVEFGPEHVEDAADVLARSHDTHRHVEPLLAETSDFRAVVGSALAEHGGLVALDRTGVCGYIVGRRQTDAHGPHIWCTPDDWAVTDPSVVADLYEVAAGQWVGDGLTRHFVFVPAVGDLVAAWFRLGFGASAVYAVRETSGAPPPSPRPPGVIIRLGTPDDVHSAARLEQELQRTLTASPSLNGRTLWTEEQLVTDWAGTWEDPAFVHFVAEQGNTGGESVRSSGGGSTGPRGRDGAVQPGSEIVGQAVLYKRPTGGTRMPASSIDLALAVTDPAVRGLGVGVALTNHVLAWARDNGYEAMTTDWRLTNLGAARFWPKRGFRETHIRMYRSIP